MLALALAVFATAPAVIFWAPYESTMGLVQKIFYFHVPGALLMLALAIFAGVMSAIFLFRKHAWADWWARAAVEQTVLFGAMTLVSGPLWARKAWGVWWEWEPRLTSTLVMWVVFIAYLLLRRYGGPGSDKLA
ncbi:MAG TPA: cytochrome c biogenesis protein CcsA, partial [Gemmatimonadaceae bacterium]|nr:cytochrome c biogenesis protein CcsA [Gemmatimonadaceae bacterium]